MVNALAPTPPNVTAATLLKPAPLIVTVAPRPPLFGVNVLIAGGRRNSKPVRVAVPPGLTTRTSPLAPAPTTAEITLSDTTVNVFAATPPKVTELAPEKPDPLIVTVAPFGALVGVKAEITGS